MCAGFVFIVLKGVDFWKTPGNESIRCCFSLGMLSSVALKGIVFGLLLSGINGLSSMELISVF